MRAFLVGMISLAVVGLCVALYPAAPASRTAMPIDTNPITPPGSITYPKYLVFSDKDARPDANDQHIFGRQLLAGCYQIVDFYVKPVALSDLLYTALRDVFEKAGRQLPATLKADLVKAKSEAELIDILAKARETCGSEKPVFDDLCDCFQAIAQSLDPYTKLVTNTDPQLNAALQVDFDGFGLEIAPHLVTDAIRITAVHPGGPAQRGGLRPGDAITHFNKQAVRELSAAKIDDLLAMVVADGPPALGGEPQDFHLPDPLEITYYRANAAKESTVKLEREQFRAETVLGVNRLKNGDWSYFLDRNAGIAHVRVSSLAKGTSDSLREVLTDLRGENMRGLILDLRWCPGGLLNEAVECAGLFLDGEKTIATVKSRNRPDAASKANKDGAFTDFPMIVLVNADTTGGAELVAAALKDHDRARIAGQRTFGKASVQTPIHLGLPYTGMRLTSGTFLRPNGKNLHRFPESKPGDDWGVCPDEDLECRLSPDTNRALREAWLLLTLRPGPSLERLLLDDPDVDVARQMAVEELTTETQRTQRIQNSKRQ